MYNSTDDVRRAIIIMPFLPRSTADLLAAQSPFRISMIAVIARDCVTACLRHLHVKKFCFADVKLDNIILQDREAPLVDFRQFVSARSSSRSL